MINESLIDQLMDITIASVWLSFMLINTRIFLVSPVLIAAVYSVIIGYLCVRFGVFIPIVERSRVARMNRARAAKDYWSSNKRNASFKWLLARSSYRAGVKALDYCGWWVDQISDGSQVTKRAAMRAEAEMWGAMNKQPSSQGRIYPVTSVNQDAATPETFSEDAQSALFKVFSKEAPSSSYRSFRIPRLTSTEKGMLPNFILDMRITGTRLIGKSETHEEDQIVASNMFDCSEEREDVRTFVETPVVRSSILRHTGYKSTAYRANRSITADPLAVLKQILARHTLGLEAYESGCEVSAFEEEEAAKCSFTLSEVESLMRLSFETYYPKDHVLSAEEREEVIEHLHAWYRSSLLIPSPSHPREEFRLITFVSFSEWFLHLADKVTASRTVHDEIPLPLELDLFDDIDTHNRVRRGGVVSVVSINGDTDEEDAITVSNIDDSLTDISVNSASVASSADIMADLYGSFKHPWWPLSGKRSTVSSINHHSK